jgi:protein-tyrosine phosphatase
LTQNFESGRKKADPYFPSEVGKSLLVPPEEGCSTPALKVTMLEQREFKKAHCVQSTVSISPYHHPAQWESRQRSSGQTDQDQSRIADIGEEVIFRHLLYLSWPDHGVPAPEDRESLLEFIKLVDHTNRDKSHCSVHSFAPPDHVCSVLDPDPPIMVGCSAGVGRTGSLIALSSLLRNYGFLPPAQPTVATIIHDSPLGPLPNDLKDDLVLQEIDSLREQRPGMVQRNEQTLLIYEVLSDAFANSS